MPQMSPHYTDEKWFNTNLDYENIYIHSFPLWVIHQSGRVHVRVWECGVFTAILNRIFKHLYILALAVPELLFSHNQELWCKFPVAKMEYRIFYILKRGAANIRILRQLELNMTR